MGLASAGEPTGLLRVAVRVSRADRERVIARLLELAPDGFDEADGADGVEFGIYTDSAGEDRIRQVFPDVRVEPVAPGWEDGWRAFHRPVRVAGLWLGPPWETAPDTVPCVVIDPGQAFGTGAHPTTRLCIELLADAPRGCLLDVGCGSGVLAIAAARLGFDPVLAIDDDPVAVETARDNARLNGVEIDVQIADALQDPIPRTEVAVANVLLAPVEAVLARLEVQVAVTSGYLVGQVPAHPGWNRTSTVSLDGWAADRFDRA